MHLSCILLDIDLYIDINYCEYDLINLYTTTDVK